MLANVIGMGIPELAAQHSLIQTGNSSAEIAVQWYFENLDNPILTQPIGPKPKGGVDENDPAFLEAVANLTPFGFSEKACKIALKKCDMNLERAGDYLMSHMGEELEDEPMGAAGSPDGWVPD